MLGQWLGFESKNEAPPSSPRKPAQRGIVISNGKKKAKENETNCATLRKTKSDELLRDFEVMRFLGTVDERLKKDEELLTQSDLERLQTLHAQACMDECAMLTDIIEHFEMEHDKLRHRLAYSSASSAAADAIRVQGNMLVY